MTFLKKILFIYLFIYLREREGGRERAGGGTERQGQANFTPSTEPNAGLDPATPRSRPEPKPRVGCSTD